MKFVKAFAAALDGKFIRMNIDCCWRKLGKDGNWLSEEEDLCTRLNLFSMQTDTWEIKPEEIVVWGICSPGEISYLYNSNPYSGLRHGSSCECRIKFSQDSLFPTDKPQKFILTPVED